MADDRRRDAIPNDAEPEPTTGQRVHREIAALATDSTISAPGATPELIAAGLAQIEAERLAFDPRGATLDHAAPGLAGGTLDLPASDQVASAGALDPGQVIGHFVIRSRLGEGGMGIVLAGHDADLGRAVAIKVVKDSAHPAYRARLLREAQVMARLEHPNVVRVYEVGSDRGRLFVAMELVDGVTLMTWLKVQRRSWREVLAMFQQVGRGLAAVHRAGLVHRDFKPDNVLVDRDGRARVADFGLARLDPERTTISPELAASLTRTGMMVGTPAYMAPEQHFGGDVDARADQYSFCISLREALIGSRPIKIEDAHWGDVPRALRLVINRGAAVDVAERFATMDELLVALDRGASRRAKYMLATAAAVMLVGGAVGAVVVMTGSSAQEAPRRTAQVPVATAELADASPASTPVVDAALPDASVVADQPIRDEAVVDKPVVKSREASRTVATSAREPAAPAAPTTTTIGATTITPMAPVTATEAATKHNLERVKPPLHEMPAAHRTAVRDALRDVGFLGLTITGTDRDADLAELETKLAATTDDLQRGMLMYAMGHVERALDNCIGAAKHWSEARKLVQPSTKSRQDKQRYDLGWLFFSRIRVGEMYCELMNGRALGVGEKLDNAVIGMWAAKDPERAEVWFASGIAQWETGEQEEGKQLLLQAGRRGSEKLRLAVDAYARAVGLTF